MSTRTNACTLVYRLLGDVNYPELSKVFRTRQECMAWFRAQGNILMLCMIQEGDQAFNFKDE